MSTSLTLDFDTADQRYNLTATVADDHNGHTYAEAMPIPVNCPPDQFVKKLRRLADHIEKRFDNPPKKAPQP
jgi:hypothetical protein